MPRSVIRSCLLGVLATTIMSCTVFATTIEQLEDLARTEAIREIGIAAGLALIDHYAATMSVEQLERLAEEALTPGLRIAAQRAIAQSEDPLQILVGLTEEELLGLAVSAETADDRLDAARTYYIKIRRILTVDRLESDAADLENRELALAAGEALAGFYSSVAPRNENALIEQAVNGATEGLRIAASRALSAGWIRTSPLKQEEIMAKIAAHTIWHTELAEAYMWVLANRFSGSGSAE